jgi:hypothetical protein
MSQLHSQRMRIDMMDKNFEEMITSVKHEIAYASKRDNQLVERRIV